MIKWIWIFLAGLCIVFPTQVNLASIAATGYLIIAFSIFIIEKLEKIKNDIEELKEKKEEKF